MDYARKIALYHNGPKHRSILKKINWFSDNNRANSSNFNATILKFSRKSKINFRMILYLVICFLRVKVSLLCRLQAVPKIHVPIFPYLMWWKKKLFDLVTCTATKPRLSGDILPNINTCKNGWSHFSESLRIVASKLLELTRFTSPNQSIYFIFFRSWGSVMMFTYFN